MDPTTSFFIDDSTSITIFEIFLLLHVRLWMMRWYYISYGYGNDWAMGEVYYYTHINWWKKRVKLQSVAADDDDVCGVHECSSPVYFISISFHHNAISDADADATQPSTLWTYVWMLINIQPCMAITHDDIVSLIYWTKGLQAV